ncbi:MAG: SurA N-terminal domain-containing protein, partial [Rhodanobacter sp.]
MLQSLGNKMKGWPSIIVLGVAVFAMSFFGIEGYFSSQVETFVAKVGKHEISQQQFQDRLNQLRQQARDQQGDSFDASVFEKPETKQRILDSMIDQQLLIQANEDLGMRVSTQAMRDTIAGIPGFQINGKFDPQTYRALLAAQNKTPDMFEDDVRTSLAISLLPDAITSSEIITDADVDRFLALRLQRRDVRYFALPRPAPADSNVGDAEIETYYKAHQADFMNPEQVSVKYIEVNGADLKLDTPPSEDDLKKRYEDEKQRFVQPEQRLVSHILINVPKNATPAQQKDALAKAEKIAAEATPADFAKLAQQDSDDLGSKSQGGDLGWLEKGVTNAAFDNALFSLQKGQISKPVLSDEGYHILWLRDVHSGEAKPFAEVRDTLAKEAQAAEGTRKFNDVAGQLVDQANQNPGSLDAAAKALNLPIKSTSLFSRNGGDGIAANAKVVAAAFSDDVLAQGNNSALINLGTNDSVVIHIDKHVAAAVRPLAEVHDTIRQKILDQRIDDAAKKRADELLARLRKGEDMQAVATSVGASLQTVKDAVRGQD